MTDSLSEKMKDQDRTPPALSARALGLASKIFLKVYYKIVENHPLIDRVVRYRDPKKYWQRRGGDRYFAEQEAVADRTLRSQFIAGQIKNLPFRSLLEIGCGYGKQLKNIHLKGLFLAGCDFSHSQLLKAKEYCPEVASRLVEADAEALPFEDKSFDLVLSSAVILHNEMPKAKKIISEMFRISRRYLVHNEDTDLTFSRYGYDMKKTYEQLNFKILGSREIPTAADPSKTQFTIVELDSSSVFVKPEEIPLQHH